MKLPSGREISNETLSSIVEFLVTDTLEADSSGASTSGWSSMNDSIRAAAESLANGDWSGTVVTGTPPTTKYDQIPYTKEDRAVILDAIGSVAEAFYDELVKVYMELYARHVQAKFPVEPQNVNMNMVPGDIAARGSL
jgi:hypothetical protein